jgi:hypothetical protein
MRLSTPRARQPFFFERNPGGYTTPVAAARHATFEH